MNKKSVEAATREQHLASAYELESKGQLEDALSECELALAAAPGSAEAHNFHGVILEQLDRRNDAIEAYRAAVHIDPDFQEACDNLSETQAELNSSQRESRTGNACRLALIGALTFGVILGLLGWFVGLSNAPRPLADGAYQIGSFDSTLNYLLTAAAIGVGAVVLALASHNPNRSLSFFIGGAIGSLLGRIIASFAISVISLVVASTSPTWVVYGQSLLSRAILGASIGAGLGIALRSKTLLSFVVAGAVGFGVADLIYQLIYSSFLTFFLPANFSPFDPRVFIALTTAFQATVGLFGGASLGWVVGLSPRAQNTGQGPKAAVEQAPA